MQRRRPGKDAIDLQTLPERVPVFPVKSTLLFPTGATSLQVGFAPNLEVLTAYTERNLAVALVHSMDDDMPIEATSLQKVGVLSRVLNRLNLPGGTVQTTIQGLIRIHIENVQLDGNHYTAFVRLVDEAAVRDEEAAPLIERILATLGGIGANVEQMADVPRILRSNLGDPGRFADLVATLAHFDVQEKDEVLQRLDVRERLEYVAERLDRQWEGIQTPSEQLGDPESRRGRSPPERAAEIRKRIATLQTELGEIDPAEKETIEALRRIEKSALPSHVAAVARTEAERLRTANPTSLEAAEIRNFLEFVLELPWTLYSDDTEIDLERVKEELQRRHVGIEDVKRRIIEFLSVARLRGDVNGSIPCIVGPPEVGKRSLAAAVARGLGRPLVRVELGGRGESQLMGSRRTRSGAKPGKIIEGFRTAGVRDPVYLLEEIDLVGLGNVEGDPVEAIEELVDPETRSGFVDRYLEVPFDLSDGIFISTANDFYQIPRSLRDFLVEIRIAGYTPEEKVEITRHQLLPRLIADHGMSSKDIEVTDETLLFLTRSYARDSGLGNLRRSLSSILRYIAYEQARGGDGDWVLDRALVEEILGTPRYTMTEAESAPEIGVVTGLAWTASGGELMFIEALKMPGTGRLIITGMLGDVMRESVSAAYSYVRSRAEKLGIPTDVFPDSDIHIHFPVGATPKDGPSAGAAVTLAIASSLADRCVRHDIAMTGEVTLRGKILDVGGIKEKILAANRAGLLEVIMPVGNERDLRDVPRDVRDSMTFHFVTHMEEVFDIALLEKRCGDESGIGRSDRPSASADSDSSSDSSSDPSERGRSRRRVAVQEKRPGEE